MLTPPEWTRIALAWDDFTSSTKAQTPIAMLSSRVGQLRLDLPEGAEVMLDDIRPAL